MVILDGGSRDLGTSFELITNVIIPNLGKDKKRLLIAINQADMAMKGRNWDYVLNRPQCELTDFLNEKARSVQDRIKEATGLSIIKPVFYSAEKKWNLDKLMDHIIDHIPYDRRRGKA
ncbi:hypothetical protein [Ursidibacter sp. B-7004-1]